MVLHDPFPDYGTIAVFGLGSSGLAAARLLSGFGKVVIASDSSADTPENRSRLEKLLPGGAVLVLGRNDTGDARAVVTSPGLQPSHPAIVAAVGAGIPVFAELETAYRASSVPIVAITGTDGKTTTTTLVSHILNWCGITNHMGGNVGIPLCDTVLEHPDDACHVVETSAFQLALCPGFAPRVLVATNIAEDHNEYFHGDRDAYIAAKRRPLDNMSAGGYAVLNASDSEMRGWKAPEGVGVFMYAAARADLPDTDGLAGFAYADSRTLRFFVNGDAGMPDGGYALDFDSTGLRGEHNAMNLMASFLAGLSMGCAFDDMVRAVGTYELPAHRIQTVRTLCGVEFIDDSKATNPHAGIAALSTVRGRIVLIVGGVDKGLYLGEWLKSMRRKVPHIMVIGELSERFCREAGEVVPEIERHCCATLQEAVVEGFKLALESGCRAVMLSPGCSSYDMFRSYAERGDVFAAAANGIEGMLIAVEGIDGVGKSTQIPRMAAYLERAGLRPYTTAEPTNGRYGAEIRAASSRLSPVREMELFALDRMEHLEREVLPAIGEGRAVIMDRYFYSSIAYQGVRSDPGHVPADVVAAMNRSFAPEADVLIYLRLDPEKSLERIRDTRGVADPFETLQNLREVAVAFDEIVSLHPHAITVDASKPVDEVTKSIIDGLKKLGIVCQNASGE